MTSLKGHESLKVSYFELSDTSMTSQYHHQRSKMHQKLGVATLEASPPPPIYRNKISRPEMLQKCNFFTSSENGSLFLEFKS